MTSFYRVDQTAHYGTAPEGSTPIDITAGAPFRGLRLAVTARREVLRAHEAGERIADLTRAYLTGADLTGARLTGAYLNCADLTDADLTAAVLLRADITDADLTGADLTGADLTGADLTGANLTDADLTDAVLTDAVLTGAVLTAAVLTGAVGIATAAEEAATWAAVRSQVLATPDRLDMSDWHCGTSHCVAGWAQELSTDPEIKALEPWIAGSRLLPRHAYLFSAADGKVLALMRAEVEAGR